MEGFAGENGNGEMMHALANFLRSLLHLGDGQNGQEHLDVRQRIINKAGCAPIHLAGRRGVPAPKEEAPGAVAQAPSTSQG